MPYDRGLNGAVAAVLREEREERGITIAELSRRASIPSVSVQRFLSARRAINMDVLEALSRGLGVSSLEIHARALRRISQPDPQLVARVLRGLQVDRITPPGPRTNGTTKRTSRTS